VSALTLRLGRRASATLYADVASGQDQDQPSGQDQDQPSGQDRDQPSGQDQDQPMDVDLTPTLELDEAAMREMDELQLQINGPPVARRDAGTRITWSGDHDSVCVVRVRERGQLVTSLHVSQRTILAAARDVPAYDLHRDVRAVPTGGIRGVHTHTEFRRRGFAQAAMRRAMAFMQHDLQVELGLLFSSRMGVPLYAGLGWQVFRGPVWCEQPDGKINYTQLMPNDPPMLLLLPGHSPSTASIDICGLPW
jgi:ribosomal protein S18 acetylase RimI-like enzyme